MNVLLMELQGLSHIKLSEKKGKFINKKQQKEILRQSTD